MLWQQLSLAHAVEESLAMVGRTVLHYVIVEQIGEGKMGVVYRARDDRLGRSVALKFLKTEHRSDPDLRARFLREARLTSALNHPNVVTVHDMAVVDDSMVIVMESVEGTTLSRLIPATGLPIDRTVLPEQAANNAPPRRKRNSTIMRFCALAVRIYRDNVTSSAWTPVGLVRAKLSDNRETG